MSSCSVAARVEVEAVPKGTGPSMELWVEVEAVPSGTGPSMELPCTLLIFLVDTRILLGLQKI